MTPASRPCWQDKLHGPGLRLVHTGSFIHPRHDRPVFLKYLRRNQMRNVHRSLVLTLLLAGLAFVGCGTQTPEPTPTPTAKPTAPPVTVTGNPHCQDESGDCKITTVEIAQETGTKHEC